MPAHLQIYYLLLAAISFAALKLGGWPERSMAFVMCLAVGLSVTVRSEWATSFQSLEVGVLIVDGVALATFFVISLIADRWWPLWITAFQILATLAHAAKIVNPGLLRAGYMTMVASSAYPHLLFLAIGIANEAARQRGRIALLSWAGFWAATKTVRITIKPRR